MSIRQFQGVMDEIFSVNENYNYDDYQSKELLTTKCSCNWLRPENEMK